MIEKFINYLRYERNRSELTVTGYERYLRDFESYFKNRDSQLSWESVDSDIIRDWMESMMDKGNTATSINRRLSALRSLYRFALSRHLVARDPAHGIAGPKKEKPLPQFVREKEMDAVLEALAATDDYKSIRAPPSRIDGTSRESYPIRHRNSSGVSRTSDWKYVRSPLESLIPTNSSRSARN